MDFVYILTETSPAYLHVKQNLKLKPLNYTHPTIRSVKTGQIGRYKLANHRAGQVIFKWVVILQAMLS